MAMFDLHGRVAAVTGASSGIGVQMAKALAGQGADLAIMARRKEKLDEVAEEIRALGVRCLAVQCDVTSTESIKNAVGEIVKEYGKVDILLNNAGNAHMAPFLDYSDEGWESTIAVDLTAVFKVAREFAKVMVKNNYGRIINTASMYGLVGATASTVGYQAAKGGVVNVTRQMAVELAQYNITVNAICPGFFPTPLTKSALESPEWKTYVKAMVPMNRNGRDGELNPAVVYLASDEASYTTGTTTVVDGGYTCM
ncbi:SDR family NAD(P)-dependent oxidoreductase [Methanoculleus methanifontis]